VNIEFPILGAKWTIGVLGLFHTGVAAMSIGFAFVVTVAQIVSYLQKDRRYDLMAKRVQLIHVCLYNIGTIVAIGLVFALSGLFPQFWSQLFVHFFWTLIVEEFLFFLLATTVTFHYFFWDHMWGHKKLHILLGALLTPLFLLQFYIINGIGGFMLTPGFQEGQVTLRQGILGWDKMAFYNPSLLMLTLHRAFANVAYGGFIVAGLCGTRLFLTGREKIRKYYEDCGRLAYTIGFSAFLALPIIGYFYAWVLKGYANEAYVNLMWGKGDVVAGGIDWWWLKHIFVALMMGVGLVYFRRSAKLQTSFTLPAVMVYTIAIFYLMFYVGMGMVMTWKFFWVSLAVALGGAALARHLLNYHRNSPQAVYVIMGVLSFMTLMLGGYVREAARPRFVDRISHYDSIYIPTERQPHLMVDTRPEELPKVPVPEKPPEAVRLIRERCIGCHTLDRVRNYPLENWELIVRQMEAYGLKLTVQEAQTIAGHLKAKKPY
jgi:cytochrome bd-type quinol oxidase subunit 1